MPIEVPLILKSILPLFSTYSNLLPNISKVLSLTLLSLILFSGYACARCKYDSTGRHLIYDDTIRGRRRAAAEAQLQQQKIQAAAAAKLDYEKLMEDLDEKPAKKSNYIQSRNSVPRELPETTLKSNYVQRVDK